jgi:20S proteasome alpha/beta subunit
VVKYRPLREVKAMTIGIGLQCPGGVVLCADRQITKSGGLKYEAQKILRAELYGDTNTDCSCVFAHDPDVARNLFKEIIEALPNTLRRQRTEGIFVLKAIQQMLEQIFKQKQAKNMEMLVAFAHRQAVGFSPFFMRIRGPIVVQGNRECIGVGDSSVLQYVSELLGRFQLSVEEAKLAGIYMVSLANRFIDGCGRGMDLVSMYEGVARLLPSEEIQELEKRLPNFDSIVAAALGAMILEKGTIHLQGVKMEEDLKTEQERQQASRILSHNMSMLRVLALRSAMRGFLARE